MREDWLDGVVREQSTKGQRDEFSSRPLGPATWCLACTIPLSTNEEIFAQLAFPVHNHLHVLHCFCVVCVVRTELSRQLFQEGVSSGMENDVSRAGTM